jgi:hypothetical protein
MGNDIQGVALKIVPLLLRININIVSILDSTKLT